MEYINAGITLLIVAGIWFLCRRFMKEEHKDTATIGGCTAILCAAIDFIIGIFFA